MEISLKGHNMSLKTSQGVSDVRTGTPNITYGMHLHLDAGP